MTDLTRDHRHRPNQTPGIPGNAAGSSLATDAVVYLVEPETWDRTVAAQLAAGEGLTLQEAHWPVLEFMRRYYAEHQIAADARHVIRYMGEELGLGHAAHKRLYELFPYGYVQQACKIAGMKRPRAWNTG